MDSSIIYLPSCEVKQLMLPATDGECSVACVLDKLRLAINDHYVLCNGRIVSVDHMVQGGCCYRVHSRMPGGKGGFGSMLRALGAQIEKTTNREACRDLSGRRMRDVNNEKKLREWAAKAGERETAREEKRKERRERIKAGAVRHKFSDPNYDQQKARIAENLDEALREALKKENSACSSSGAGASCLVESRKRKAPCATLTDPKKARDWIATDIDLSSSSSSDAEGVDDDIRPPIEVDEQSSSSSSSADSFGLKSDPSTSTGESTSSKDDEPALEVQPVSLLEPRSEHESSSGSHSVPDETVEEIKPPQVQKPFNLDDYKSANALELLGLDMLKSALMERGLKCGGTLEQRAQRLFSIKGLSVDQIDKSLFAKPSGKK